MSKVDTPNENLNDLINSLIEDMKKQADIWSDPSDIGNISSSEEVVWQWCAAAMRGMAYRAELILKELE